MFSCVPALCDPWTEAARLLCSRDFPGKNWSGLPFPPPGDLPDPGVEPRSPALQVDSLLMHPLGSPEASLLVMTDHHWSLAIDQTSSPSRFPFLEARGVQWQGAGDWKFKFSYHMVGNQPQKSSFLLSGNFSFYLLMLSCVNVMSMSVLLLSCGWNHHQDSWVETWRESGPVDLNDVSNTPTWILPHICASCSGHDAIPCCFSHFVTCNQKHPSQFSGKAVCPKRKLCSSCTHMPSLLPSLVCLFRPYLGCGHNELGWLPWLEYGSGVTLVCGSASYSTWKDVVCVFLTVGYVVILMILASTWPPWISMSFSVNCSPTLEGHSMD